MAKKKLKKVQEVDRKKLIIDAALQLFMKQGAPFVRLNEVAKAAKVPAPLIHYYFKNIEDLHREIIMIAIQDLVSYSTQGILDHQNALEKMRFYLRGPLIWAAERPELMSIWTYFYYTATFSADFNRLNTQFRETGRQRISLMIYEGLEQGVFKLRAGSSVQMASEEIQAILTGQAILFATEEKKLPIQFFIDRVNEYVSSLLGVKIKST